MGFVPPRWIARVLWSCGVFRKMRRVRMFRRDTGFCVNVDFPAKSSIDIEGRRRIGRAAARRQVRGGLALFLRIAPHPRHVSEAQYDLECQAVHNASVLWNLVNCVTSDLAGAQNRSVLERHARQCGNVIGLRRCIPSSGPPPCGSYKLLDAIPRYAKARRKLGFTLFAQTQITLVLFVLAKWALNSPLTTAFCAGGKFQSEVPGWRALSGHAPVLQPIRHCGRFMSPVGALPGEFAPHYRPRCG